MHTLIESYVSVPGEHCGSTAMRNLIRHYTGSELSEAMVFGLGSGIDLIYLEIDSDEISPATLAFGRGITLEIDVASALGIDYREAPELDDARAWEWARQEVAEGRPTMLSGDAYYLDYRNFGAHFPAHRFVLVGFDDETETAYVADRLDPEPQPCSYSALRSSRNPPDFISTYNLAGKFHGTRATRSLAEACGTALVRTTRRMLGDDTMQVDLMKMMGSGRPFECSAGLSGIARFREHVKSWPARGDCAKTAEYAANCIEKYGSGGANFRNLYAAFLGEAHAIVPALVGREALDLVAASAQGWSELARRLQALAERPEQPEADACADALGQILELEARLFEGLAEARARSAS